MTRTITQTAPAIRATRRFSLIGWLLRLDARFRDYVRFKSLDDERLNDIGMTRRERDQVFYRQFAGRDER